MIAQVDPLYLKINPAAAVRRVLTRAFFEGRPVTTKGRWFNPIVLGHFALEKRLPQFKQVSKPVFIIGTGRSGTTILGTLLSMHPDVGLLNEPKAMWYSIYDGEDVSGNYTLGPARYRLNETDVTLATRQNAHKLFGAYLTMVLANRVIDKNPEIVFRVPFIKAIFPDAKFVFLVRNGWHTIYSIAQWSGREGTAVNGQTQDWWGVNNRKWHLMLQELVQTDPFFNESKVTIKNLTDHTNMAVIEWIVTMREGMAQMQNHPNDIYLFRYEDLLEAPQQALAKLLSFCELSNSQKLLDYATQRLKPAPQHPTLQINPDLLPLFTQIMQQLGYN